MLVLIVFGLGGLVFWPLLHYACRQACGEPLGGREVVFLCEMLSEQAFPLRSEKTLHEWPKSALVQK